MKNKTKRTLKRIGLILAIALVGGVFGAFAASGTSMFDRDLNPDNLIKVENYVVKDKDDNGNGIDVKVDDDGVIKLNGKATADDEYTVTELVLEPGEYTLSGFKSDKSKVGLKATFGTSEHYAGTSSDTFVLESSTTVTIVVYVADDHYCLNTTIKPVLVTGDEAGEFYK